MEVLKLKKFINRLEVNSFIIHIKSKSIALDHKITVNRR